MKKITLDRLPVKDRSGEVLYYVSAATAQRLIDNGRCVPVGTKNVVRALNLNPGEDDSKVIPISAYVGQRYSSKRETRENPQGVWTLRRFPSSAADIFRAVPLSCMKPAA